MPRSDQMSETSSRKVHIKLSMLSLALLSICWQLQIVAQQRFYSPVVRICRVFHDKSQPALSAFPAKQDRVMMNGFMFISDLGLEVSLAALKIFAKSPFLSRLIALVIHIYRSGGPFKSHGGHYHPPPEHTSRTSVVVRSTTNFNQQQNFEDFCIGIVLGENKC